jgi:hypothetical protein
MLLHLCTGIASVDSSVGWKMSADHPLHVLMALLLPPRRERGTVREGQARNWSGSPLLLSNLNYYIYITQISLLYPHFFYSFHVLPLVPTSLHLLPSPISDGQLQTPSGRKSSKLLYFGDFLEIGQ